MPFFIMIPKGFDMHLRPVRKQHLQPMVAATMCALAICQSALAQSERDNQPVAAPRAEQDGLQRNLELSTGFQNLSNGFGNWRDVSLRGTYGVGAHVLQGEVLATQRFGENGAFVGVSDTVTFNEDWYASVAAGAGDGAFYLPRYRLDATVYKKWLADRSLVTSVGAGYYKAPDGHTDNSLSLGLVYYFSAPFIAEAGVRLNSSNPGAIKTRQQFVALTYGRSKQDLFTVRHTWGREGYQTIASDTQLVNFRSNETSIAWRHWMNARTGVLVGANRYTNPFYNRSGVNVGIFHDF